MAHVSHVACNVHDVVLDLIFELVQKHLHGSRGKTGNIYEVLMKSAMKARQY